MTFVYKEYEDKKYGTRAMTTAKNKIFIGLLLENCYLVGEMNFWWGERDKNLVRRKSNAGTIFPSGGKGGRGG